VSKEPTIPQGTLKQLNIEDVKWDKRYREEFGDLEDLAESIKDKGILQPITVSTDMVLLAGERRIRAAKLAGLTKIPALVRKVEGEIDAREIELIENLYRKDFTWVEVCRGVRDVDSLYKAKNFDWSGRKTAVLLQRSRTDVNRALQLASAIEVMPELRELKTADEAFKVVKKMEETAIVGELRNRQQARMETTAPGLERGIQTMLKLADSNYIIGDTFKGLTELRSNGSIQLIECDPPYGIDLTKVKASKDSASSNIHKYNEVSQEAYPEFLKKLTKELFRVAGQHSWLVFWFGPTWHYPVYSALKDAGWQVDDIPCIWTKHHGQTLQPEIYLARGYEPFFMCRKGLPALIKRGRLNVFDFPGIPGGKKIHPTERPVALIEEILGVLGVPQSTVLVPFLGSGNTLRAAYNLGMRCFGWDISGEYKDKFMLSVEQDARALSGDDEE
jgi:ParB/RepB/Spo0J family partition protein